MTRYGVGPRRRVLRMRLGELRRIVRSVLLENPCGPGVTADPTDVKGFYPYEVERGTDIQGYWYKSPGDKGSNDPMRPENPADYIGFNTKGTRPDEAAEQAAPKKGEGEGASATPDLSAV